MPFYLRPEASQILYLMIRWELGRFCVSQIALLSFETYHNLYLLFDAFMIH